MQVPIIQGVYTNVNSVFRTFYPINLIPSPTVTGISNGYLKAADGLVEFLVGDNVDRGGIEWNNEMYRVMGNKLVKITSSGVLKSLGTLESESTNTQVTFDYSFDRLAIASDNKLFYWDNNNLTQVTDPDLGDVIDMLWVDGYFMTTDGEYIIVTELSDPTQVKPTKYGSSEANPDPIKALIKVKNEVYALNRHTIEVFSNVGGAGFPFARVETAQIDKGVIGTHACCTYMDMIAFVGGGKNEAIAIWLGLNSVATKISTKEIDRYLQDFTEVQLSNIVVEARVDKTHQFLYVHLPDKTLVYDAIATQLLNLPVWFILNSAGGAYKARNFVRVYDKWYFGDPTSTKIGYLDESVNSHFGQTSEWEVSTGYLYNDTHSAIIHEVTLTVLNNSADTGYVYTSHSFDGLEFTTEIPVSLSNRLVWFNQGSMIDRRIQKFRGTSNISLVRLDLVVEGLSV